MEENKPKDRLSNKTLKKMLEDMKSTRYNWESQWQDIADYVLPRKNDIITDRSPGEKRNTFVFDNTGMVANELLAGALHSMLTSPNSYWFDLTTGDQKLDRDDAVKFYLENCRNRMHVTMNNSNFQTEVHELYLDLCGFNTACMITEEDEKEVVRFNTKYIKEYFIGEDSKGRVNHILREWKWTSSHLVEAFGEENLPEKVIKSYHDGKQEKYRILHAVYPESMVPSSVKTQKPWVSQYILVDLDHVIRVERFLENPYVVPRWAKASGEVYGRGPGITALPEVKTLNKMSEITLKGAQKVVDPPLQLPDDGFIMPIVVKPGGLNYYRSGTQDYIRPIFNDTKIDFGFQAMEEKRKRVRESFYVDQLQLQQASYMTATEVMQRTEERMRLLGPLLGRMQSEFLSPLIDRVFGIMDRRNMFGTAPEVLKGQRVAVRFSSVIAKAQRVTDAQAIDRTVQTALPFIQTQQEVVDNFNGDEALRIIAEIHGLPGGILRTKKEVAAIREQRAQQQQAMMAQQQQAVEQQTTGQMVAAAQGQKQQG